MKVGIGVFAAGPSGLPVSVLETALALRRAGVDVTTFMAGGVRLPPAARELEASAARLEPMPAAFRNPRAQQAAQLAHRLALGRRLARALRDHPVDILHLFSPATAAALPGEPPVVVQSWFWPPTLRGRLRIMMPFARRGPAAAVHLAAEVQSHVGDELGYRHAALVLANTRTAEDALRGRGFPTARVPACIHVPAALPERTAASTLRLAFSAYNLASPRKGLRLLLDALPALPPGRMRLTLVGGWSERLRPAVDRVRRSGTEVVVLGRVPRERYLELLARETDVLVMGSLYEEWGYALFEALSLGVPAIALPRYPFAEVLDGSLGVLAGDASPEGIAAALQRALAGELPAPATVQAATRERFGAHAIAPRLVAAYERAARGSAVSA